MISSSQTTAYLAKILIYPIKSLDGILIPQASILKSGALKHDRRWAMFDEQGKYINGKRNSKIYQLRALFDEKDLTNIRLEVEGTSNKIEANLARDRSQLESWLSNYFGIPVSLKENKLSGFPDDTSASGPTIISTATLETIANWFDELSVAEMRRRLRANLEINGVPAFWEDHLFANTNQWVNFQIGDVFFQGINPCQRCIVPTKDSQTGKITEKFQQHFITKRKETLPDWVNTSQFNHFYRVSVNTKISTSEVDKCLKVGDKLEIIGIEET